jgi:hypothetical protein
MKNRERTRAFIFDIDGTVANLEHRLHFIQRVPKDWDSFFSECWKDMPIAHIREVVRALLAYNRRVIFVSGRSDRVRQETETWLRAAIGHFDNLYMRADGDHRPDHIVKGELLDRIIDDGYLPVMAFDDRSSVVAMWRARGVPCAQVAPGDF